MKVIIIGGFLGAGKTSAILQMVNYLGVKQDGKNLKAVVLENEIGQISIDDKIIANAGMKVETLFSGCICCTMSGELIANVALIYKKFNPEWLIIETTGMAYPHKVRELLQESYPNFDCYLICIVDAKRWRRIQKVPELHEFSEGQMQSAECILVNKCDLVSEEEKKALKCEIQQINSKAVIYLISTHEALSEEIWKKVFAI